MNLGTKGMKKKGACQELPFLLAYNQVKLKRGFALDRFLNLFCRGKKNKPFDSTPSKILVIQSHLIGDVMMAIPLLRSLRQRFPTSKIYLLANEFSRELLLGVDFLDGIWTAPFPWGLRNYHIRNIIKLGSMIIFLRRQKFDLAIDAQIDFRNIFLMFLIGAKRRLGYDIVGGRLFLTDVPDFPNDVVHLLEGRLSVLKYLGASTNDKSYRLSLPQDSRDWAESFWEQKGWQGQLVVALHPGASTKEKLWPVARFAELIRLLKGKNLFPVLVEGPGEHAFVEAIRRMVPEAIDVVKVSLRNLLAFFSKCRLVICLDSAAAHLASAVNVPAVVLYGPQWPTLTKPFDENIIGVWTQDVDCRPCIYKDCRHQAHDCMNKIQAEDVWRATEALLEKTRCSHG